MQTVLAFLVLMLPLTLSPGPATITLAGLGMSKGIARSLPVYFGLVISTFVIAAACGMGLNEVLFANAVVYDVIRYAGLLYIIYLAVKFIRARPSATQTNESDLRFYDGLLLTALNPKFYVMVTVVFSQFLKPRQDAVWFLIFGLTAVIGFSAFVWLAAGASLRPLLKSEWALRMQTVTFGVLLLLVVTFMLLEGSHYGGRNLL